MGGDRVIFDLLELKVFLRDSPEEKLKKSVKGVKGFFQIVL
jgi:hypothetical protein